MQTELDNTEMDLNHEYKENDRLNDEINVLTKDIDSILRQISKILKDNNLKLEENMEYIPIKYIKYVKNWSE